MSTSAIQLFFLSLKKHHRGVGKKILRARIRKAAVILCILEMIGKTHTGLQYGFLNNTQNKDCTNRPAKIKEGSTKGPHT